MGEYFVYASIERKEYFFIDALGGATKFVGIGRNLGARAVGLLLLRREPPDPRPLVGAWAGTQVIVLGDESGPRALYEEVRESWRDLASAVAVMLFRVDGPDDLLERAERDADIFLMLAELALVHRVEGLGQALGARFGMEWKNRYAKLRRESRTIVPPP